MSFFFALLWLRRKLSRAKGNPFIQILEYRTPRLKFKTQISISNSVGAKFPAGTSELIPFGANWDLHWNCTAGTLEFIPFVGSLHLHLDLRFPEIPYQGFLLVSPRWGLLCLFVRVELHIFPSGIYHTSHFLGNYINHQRIYCLHSPRPSIRLRTYIRLKI